MGVLTCCIAMHATCMYSDMNVVCKHVGCMCVWSISCILNMLCYGIRIKILQSTASD